jgi:thiamine-monophosphate kinase
MSKPTSENEIIQLLKNRYPGKSRSIKKGIGDDAAIIRPGLADEYWAITADMLLEEIDFRRDWITPRGLGSKSIAVNLSDLAAMGAQPRFFTVSLAVPAEIPERWIMEFYEGLTDPESSMGAQLIGGDLSHSESGMVISITAMGESKNRRLLYRSGGKPGDLLYVTGILGKSAAGLKLLQAGHLHPRELPQREAVRAHQMPVPRCEAGVWLAQCGMVSCMMDLSDGLSTDLPRLCTASGVGAEIYTENLPVFQESRMWNCNPVELALNGGEDFELLFAVSNSRRVLFEKSYPSKFPQATKIGKMTRDGAKTWLIEPDGRRRLMKELGYDHFRRTQA